MGGSAQTGKGSEVGMRLIDADALIGKISKVYDIEEKEDLMWAKGLHYSKVIIREEPTIDAVPLVRCKDCKKHDTYDCHITYLTTQKSQNDWFCADGERTDT